MPSTSITDLRIGSINSEISLEGVIVNTCTYVDVLSVALRCPECEKMVNVDQNDSQTIALPKVCESCGRRGEFPILSKNLHDAGILTISDDNKSIDVKCLKPLTDPLAWNQFSYGTKVRVHGRVCAEPESSKTTFYKYGIRASNVEVLGQLLPEEKLEIFKNYMNKNFVALNRDFYENMGKIGLQPSDVKIILDELLNSNEIILLENRKKEISVIPRPSKSVGV